jgi:endonuclease V-like protein UPF0215 family
MPLHLNKPALRALGIAESFTKYKPLSRLAGVVIRGDLRIDGIAFSNITVGGDDATEGILRIYDKLDRMDINIILLNGAVIGWFNIVDLLEIHERLAIPVLCLTYEESSGLEKYILDYFPADEEKMRRYRRLGQRELVKLKTGYDVYIRSFGIASGEAKILLNRFTFDGRVPEPLRIARQAARAALNADCQENL